MGTNESCRHDHLFQQAGYDVMAAAFEVYNTLGSGFLEEVYQESLSLEFAARKIPFVSKVWLPLRYKSTALRKGYEADFLVQEGIILELKSVRALAPEHEAQLFNYLKAAEKTVGYLLNFGSPHKLQWKRFVL